MNQSRHPLRQFTLLPHLTRGILAFVLLACFVPRANAQAPLSVDSVSDATGFVIAPGGTDTLRFDVRNAGNTPVKATARWEIVDGDGKPLSTLDQPVALAAGTVSHLPFEFSPKNLGAGEYGVRLSVETSEDHKVAFRYEQSVAVAGPRDAFILFNKEPVMRGMDFDRAGMSPVLLTVNGVQHWAWQGGESRGAETWWHALMLRMTDPRFRDSAMPAVDITVNFRHAPDAPVNLFGDTATGSREVASGWGRNEGWQTMRTEVDDAKFARTDYHSEPAQRKSDGFDLRFNSCNAPVEARSVFVRGYDRDVAPDFRRLLRFTSLDMGRELFIVRPGEKLKLSLNLRNLARVPLKGDYALTLTDDLDKVLWKRGAATEIGSGAYALLVAFDATGLKQGLYTLSLGVGRADKDGNREELLNPAINLLISEQSVIPKAKPGDFLYGVDPGVDFRDDRWMQWLDFMGCDITRGNGANENPDEWTAAFAAWDRHGIQNSVFWNVPYDRDPAVLETKTLAAVANAEAVARKFGTRARYWELGNEPDLFFFYPDIELYEKGMTRIAKAVKHGNPDAVVMNGGLANGGGPEAHPNSAKFLHLVPADALDAIAYHGHGPLVSAERSAYNNIRAMLVENGKGKLPQMDTESGVSARTPGQMRIQARTAVEKTVFAQSVGSPTFMWFRLHIEGGDGDYTSTKNVHEPRSVVLSYRTMARVLKGLRFVRALDLGIPGAEGYLFAERGGGRRALVTWANDQGGGTATLRLGGAGGPGVANVRQVDLFGNVTARRDASSGVTTVPVDLDPVYLAWSDPGATGGVTVLPNPLSVSPTVYVSPGGSDAVTVRVRNTERTPLVATLTARAGAASGVSPVSAATPIRVGAGATQTVSIPVRVAAKQGGLLWPRRWTVFAPVPTGSVPVADFPADIPARLLVNGVPLLPRAVTLVNDRVDLAPIGGGVAEKREAILFATIDSPSAQTVRIGSSADWWEQWFVNGVPVFDTLETGNGGPQSILEHTFTATLRAGRNLLAVRVLSGSGGWKLYCGGPEQIAEARGASDGGGSMTIELRRDGAVLARAKARVARRVRLLAPLPLAAGDSTALYERADPAGALREEGVVNEWAKQPDSARWWHGPDDLSGDLWCRADAAAIYVVAAVHDDAFRPGEGAAGIDSGDSLRIALADPAGKVIQLGVPGAGGAVYSRAGASGAGTAATAWAALPAGRASAVVERVGSVTYYRVRVARELCPAERFAVNILANDDDGFGHKQSVTWFPGIDDPFPPTDRWWQCEVGKAVDGVKREK